MQEIIPNFTSVMSWLVLGLASVAVALLSLEARHQPNQPRAFLGLIGMVLVLIATATSLIMLVAHSSSHGLLLSQLFLPLVAPLLLISFLRLSFSPSPLASSPDLVVLQKRGRKEMGREWSSQPFLECHSKQFGDQRNLASYIPFIHPL